MGLQEELDNSKDQMKALVAFVVKHTEESKKAHEDLMSEIVALKEDLQPTIDAFKATEFVKSFGGWAIAFIGGIIVMWNYILQYVREGVR